MLREVVHLVRLGNLLQNPCLNDLPLRFDIVLWLFRELLLCASFHQIFIILHYLLHIACLLVLLLSILTQFWILADIRLVRFEKRVTLRVRSLARFLNNTFGDRRRGFMLRFKKLATKFSCFHWVVLGSFQDSLS